ncbi:fibroblast growth factor-binding protein 1-like [Centropristis striata]|uniref:fibroblast growth factor-binding protein 1-like n=1 Tax=Centropristis striata TaxID=184440 RepID=UPI0027E0E49E|nr:fibroblast growth factor-binding protein 1-like [Centropristis striata]
MLLKTLAPWLLLAFVGLQVSLSSGARKKNREAGKSSIPAAELRYSRGKFAGGGKMLCTRSAVNDRDRVRVTVKCEDPEARVKGGVTELRCNYYAKPHGCPGYLSNNKNFWKQVGRAFKKLKGKVCKDERSGVGASMCKRAPLDVHFELDKSSAVSLAQSGGDETLPLPRATAAAGKNCTERADHRKTAEENCGSWFSVCNFFMSMLQSDNC